MNAFGIDYQRSLSVVWLREGRGPAARFRSVGDGSSRLIPNAVAGEKLWASRAMQAAEPGRASGSDTLIDGPWLDEPGASLFWRGLYQRLYSYLGRMSPTVQNGYNVAVAIQAEDLPAGARKLDGLCR